MYHGRDCAILPDYGFVLKFGLYRIDVGYMERAKLMKRIQPLLLLLALLAFSCSKDDDEDAAVGGGGGSTTEFPVGAVHELGSEADLDVLLNEIGEDRIVLLGEASHGTAEFYIWRAAISKRLIEEKGFTLIAVEGDWTDRTR